VPQLCMLLCTQEHVLRPRRRPKTSMISISPHVGHPTSCTFEPNIQKAGHRPFRHGAFMRASTTPKVNSKRRYVEIRDERIKFDSGSRIAVMDNTPSRNDVVRAV